MDVYPFFIIVLSKDTFEDEQVGLLTNKLVDMTTLSRSFFSINLSTQIPGLPLVELSRTTSDRGMQKKA